MKLEGEVPLGGFSTMPVISKAAPNSFALADDAILMGVFGRDFLDRDDIAAMLVIGFDALLQAALPLAPGRVIMSAA